MSAQAKHPYHMVNPSPWPIMGAFSGLVAAVGAVTYFHKVPLLGLSGVAQLLPGLGLVILTMILWWRDVINESVKQHAHTDAVAHGLRMGMVLFIACALHVRLRLKHAKLAALHESSNASPSL